jgi:hypothetical protein
VCIHQEDQWYQLILRAEESDYLLSTPQQVHYVITQVNRARQKALSPHSTFQGGQAESARSNIRRASSTA